MRDDLNPSTPDAASEKSRRRKIVSHPPHVSIGNSTIAVTFFEDQSATSKKEINGSLIQLRDKILKTSAAKKAELPWLKLAQFGDLRSENNCLRHDKNVIDIGGVELDYDGMRVAFDDGLRALEAVRIAALIYTSPSHTIAQPKWRILAPTSQPLPNEMRRTLLARLNGFLKARLGEDPIASHESFTLSQSYYFGRDRSNRDADHRAEVLLGSFIDHRDDLAEYEEIGVKNQTPKGTTTTPQQENGAQQNNDDDDWPRGYEARIALLGDGEGLRGFYNVLLRATASYVATYFYTLDQAKLKKLLRDKIAAAPKNDTPQRAESIKRYTSDKWLDDAIEGAIKEFTDQLPVRLEDDFVADMETHQYVFLPTRSLWPSSSVNARFPRGVALLDPDGHPILNAKGKPIRISASEWLDRNRPIEQRTWVPGEALLIKDKLFSEGGWFERIGVTVLNQYRPPVMVPGNKLVSEEEVAPWLGHIRKIYPDETSHIIAWLAHRVQRPHEKINHALFLGGAQGIGKDTILEPIRHGVGPWNCAEVSPTVIVKSNTNGFLKSVILRVSEARDLGEVNRFTFYEAIKTHCAAPPDSHRINEKYVPEYRIPNVCGMIITSNYKTGGVYLPADDRRHYVAWSNATKEDFTPDYWTTIWNWYETGGNAKVVTFLKHYDLSGFNAKAPPEKTEAFFAIVTANSTTEETELVDVLEQMGNPDVVTLEQIMEQASSTDELYDFAGWLTDRRNRRQILYRMEHVGYVPIRNELDRKEGRWAIGMRRRTVYGKQELSRRDAVEAVKAMIDKEREKQEAAPQRNRSHPFGR